MTHTTIRSAMLSTIGIILVSAAHAQSAQSGAAIQPAAPPQICVNNNCKVTASLPSNAAAGSGVKWHPGNYVSGTIVATSGQLSAIESEIDGAFNTGGSGNNAVGYILTISWDMLEDSQNVYTFSFVDSIRSYIASNHPGKRLGISLIYQNYFGNSCATYVPSYILNNSSYGPSSGTSGVSPQYGYWQIGNKGCTAAQWRPAIVARLVALSAALASHPSPYSSGYTYDTDPFVEMVSIFGESDPGIAQPYPPDYSTQSQVTTAQGYWESGVASFVGNWPHTIYFDQNNFWSFLSAGGTVGVTNADCAVGAAASSPDVYTQSSFTWGQQAFAGLVSGSTSQLGKCGSVAWVQWGDYGTSLPQLFTAAATGLRADHIIWDMYAASINWASNIEPFVAANPLPANNTVCPSVYVSLRGGCNSN
jgi:hypothetical protein